MRFHVYYSHTPGSQVIRGADPHRPSREHGVIESTRVLVTGMKGSLFLAVALVMALPGETRPQVPTAAADLKIALSELQSAVGALSPILRSPRLVSAVQWLDQRYTATNPANVSEEYVRSLRRAAELLNQQQKLEVVADVTSDLEVKVEHCRRLGIGMGGSVLLTVNTRRGPRTVGDLQVLYLLKFDEWLKREPRHFFRASSPTETQLEPGRYWVWAHDPATNRTSDRVLVEVVGQKEFVLDLPVP